MNLGYDEKMLDYALYADNYRIQIENVVTNIIVQLDQNDHFLMLRSFTDTSMKTLTAVYK